MISVNSYSKPVQLVIKGNVEQTQIKIYDK